MCTTHVLTTPNFTKAFIMECDSLSHGISEILMKEGRSLASESFQLKGMNLIKPIYEK
jgi:hypothetical protein